MSFLLISLTMVTLLYGYSGWRLIPPAQLASPWNLAAWLGLLLLAVLPHTSIFLRGYFIGGWGTLLSWIAYLGLGFFTLLFCALLVRDLVWLSWLALGQLAALAKAQGAPETVDPLRRQFLLNSTNLAALGAAVGLTGYGVYQARRRPRVERVEVPIAGLPPELDGFRIAQFSDIHAGPTIKRPHVQKVAEAVNSLGADLIAFTGDLADGSVERLRSLVEPLAQLRAPHGCFFVTGNHEYYSGVREWMAEARRLGFIVLHNEHRLLRDGRLLLAGVTDFGGGDFHPEHASDPEAAVAGAPPGAIRILLAHQPRSIFAAAGAGFHLQLSGHTHGGQFVPWKYLIPLQQPYIAGLYRHGQTWVYVSRGAGYWGPPVRVGAPAEIGLLVLRAA